MIIAVDFDGTIVDDAYPRIGKEKRFAFQTLRELQKERHKLILWTCRKGKTLEEAVEFCRINGVDFYAVNSNYPGESMNGDSSPKIVADVYIDDRNIGGFPGWSEVWQIFRPDQILEMPQEISTGFFSKIFNSFSGL